MSDEAIEISEEAKARILRGEDSGTGLSLERREQILLDHIATLTAERDRLEAFRKGVVGWRETDQPEWFCRNTAELIADYGRNAEEREG